MIEMSNLTIADLKKEIKKSGEQDFFNKLKLCSHKGDMIEKLCESINQTGIDLGVYNDNIRFYIKRNSFINNMNTDGLYFRFKNNEILVKAELNKFQFKMKTITSEIIFNFAQGNIRIKLTHGKCVNSIILEDIKKEISVIYDFLDFILEVTLSNYANTYKHYMKEKYNKEF